MSIARLLVFCFHPWHVSALGAMIAVLFAWQGGLLLALSGPLSNRSYPRVRQSILSHADCAKKRGPYSSADLAISFFRPALITHHASRHFQIQAFANWRRAIQEQWQ